MSPLMIEILLHYLSRTDDYRNGDFYAPAVRQAIDWLNDNGFLKAAQRGTRRSYHLAERGEVYVKALCEIPFPIQIWVIPEIKLENDHGKSTIDYRT